MLTSLTLGLRHGFEWDHIAAISDLTSTAENPRRGFALSMLYALGHAMAVFVLGAAAIAFGLAIPDRFDTVMGRVVGVTLIVLGTWILFELARKGRDFRLRSRWMLVIDGASAGVRKARNQRGVARSGVEHGHSHHHLLPSDSRAEIASANSGTGAATGIGVLHGIGVESPTQIAIFVASSSAAGVGFGLGLLALWILGLLAANALLALLAGAGLLHAERSFPVYAGLAIVVSVMSIGLGVLYLFGLDVSGLFT